MRDVLVQITQEDIDKAIPGTIFDNPLAIAIRRRLGHEYYAQVTKGGIYCRRLGKDGRMELGDALQQFLRDFNENRVVQPTYFILEVNDEI